MSVKKAQYPNCSDSPFFRFDMDKYMGYCDNYPQRILR